MSSILKGLNESYFSPSERDQQNAMDTRRRSDLSGERNAGLNEPDELPTSSAETRNGVYEYSVPTGQEKIAQELGLQLHKGHWFSRVPVQRANFQFGRPQFHEIPSKNVSEAEQDYGPEYQEKVKRLGQMAKQGERKTVYDPIKRVYKTVPVNSPKEQGVTEGVSLKQKHEDEKRADQNQVRYGKMTQAEFDKKWTRTERPNPTDKKQGVAEGLSKRDQQDVAAIRAAIARLEAQLNHPNADRDAILQSIAHEKKRLALYGQDVAEGKDDKIAQLKKDHDTAVHWSKNETSPQKREAARQKAEKIKRHLETQYKQGVAEGFPKDPNAPKLVQDRKTGKWYDPNKEFEKKMNSPEVIAQMKRMAQKEDVAEGVAETLPMDDAVKVLRQYGAGHFKTTSNELHFYKQGRPFSVDLVMNPDATRSVTLSSLNSATRGLKGQGVAEGSEYKSRHAHKQEQDKAYADYRTKHATSSMALMTRAEFAKDQRERAAKKKQGVAEGQLDELKCWSGYTRVQGVPAGAPGSCKKKTNEEGVAEVKKNNKNDDHEPFDYDEWKASTVKPRKPRGYKDAEALGKALDREQSELRKRQQGVAEEQEEKCPHCGGAMFSEMIMNEKKDACYYKVKSRYKVWPSAYASGALVKCRKSGADSWGNGGKKNESSILEGIEQVDENLHKWFKEKWVRFGPDGKIRGDCARGDDSEGKPKCLPQSKAQNLGKKGRASAAARKRREDPNPERSGKAINVNTKKKSNEGVAEGIVSVGDTVWAKHPIQRYKSVTGKVLHTDDNSTKIQHRDGTTGTYPNTDVSNDYEELNPNPYRKKEQGVAEAQLDEKWSTKYKDSINCSNPKGFSQRAHCQGKNK
jgi:phosphoglycolate phosphatase-like HAD superfamily hydrolase